MRIKFYFKIGTSKAIDSGDQLMQEEAAADVNVVNNALIHGCLVQILVHINE